MFPTRLSLIRDFASEFGKDPLYQSGYAFAWLEAGIVTASNVEKADAALAFIQGYASGCILACPHGGRSHKIADVMIRATIAFRTMLDTFASTDRVMACVDSYRREILECIALPEDQSSIVHVCARCGSHSPESCGC